MIIRSWFVLGCVSIAASTFIEFTKRDFDVNGSVIENVVESELEKINFGNRWKDKLTGRLFTASHNGPAYFRNLDEAADSIVVSLPNLDHITFTKTSIKKINGVPFEKCGDESSGRILNSHIIWKGETPDGLGKATFMLLENDQMNCKISVSMGKFRCIPCGDDFPTSCVHVVELSNIVPAPKQRVHELPHIIKNKKRNSNTISNAPLKNERNRNLVDDGSVIDVLIIVTTAVIDYYGGEVDTYNEIVSLIENTNNIFLSHSIDLSMKIVLMYETDFEETGDPLDTYNYLNDGEYLDYYREVFNADLVSIYTMDSSIESDYFLFMASQPNPVSSDTDDNYVSIIDAYILDYDLYLLEGAWGFNFGCTYNREISDLDREIEYAYGYSSENCDFHTILASGCDDSDSVMLPYYSTSQITYTDTGEYLGDAATADCAQVINDYKLLISQYRDSSSSTSSPSSSITTSSSEITTTPTPSPSTTKVTPSPSLSPAPSTTMLTLSSSQTPAPTATKQTPSSTPTPASSSSTTDSAIYEATITSVLLDITSLDESLYSNFESVVKEIISSKGEVSITEVRDPGSRRKVFVRHLADNVNLEVDFSIQNISGSAAAESVISDIESAAESGTFKELEEAPSNESDSFPMIYIIIIVLAAVAGLVAAALCIFCCFMRKKEQTNNCYSQGCSSSQPQGQERSIQMQHGQPYQPILSCSYNKDPTIPPADPRIISSSPEPRYLSQSHQYQSTSTRDLENIDALNSALPDTARLLSLFNDIELYIHEEESSNANVEKILKWSTHMKTVLKELGNSLSKRPEVEAKVNMGQIKECETILEEFRDNVRYFGAVKMVAEYCSSEKAKNFTNEVSNLMHSALLSLNLRSNNSIFLVDIRISDESSSLITSVHNDHVSLESLSESLRRAIRQANNLTCSKIISKLSINAASGGSGPILSDMLLNKAPMVLRKFQLDESRIHKERLQHVFSDGFSRTFLVKYEGKLHFLKVTDLSGVDLVVLQSYYLTLCWEMFVLCTLQNQYISTPLGYTGTLNEFSILYEHFANGSLRSVIEGPHWNRIEPETKHRILVNIAKGMMFLHENRIHHSSLSSRNIMLLEDYTPKISNFGFALTESDVTKFASRAKIAFEEDAVWMAPEKFNEKKAGHSQKGDKCDVYSYGMITYEVLSAFHSKKVPWSNLKFDQVIENKKKRVLPTLPDGFDGEENVLSAKLHEEIMVQCLEKTPTHRPTFADIIRIHERIEEA